MSKPAEPPVSAHMRADIEAFIDDLEREENVRILLAVESGSRAWGFHSPDSDYDVRFIYARPPEWHYRLDKTRDVIERPIDDELDVSGWELGKAIGLAVRSNSVVAEWLQSPIVYRKDDEAVAALTNFCRTVLDRKSVSWHYLNLLRRQERRILDEDGNPRLKRYFYMVRPAMALRWMRINNAAMPPMDITSLIAGCSLSETEHAALEDLLQQKMRAREAETFAQTDPVMDALIEAETRATHEWLAAEPTDKTKGHWEAANALHMQLSGFSTDGDSRQ